MIDDPLNPGSRIAGSDLVDINIPVGQKLPAKATETVAFRCNLDSRVPTLLPMGLNGNDLVVNGTVGGSVFRVTFSEGPDAGSFLRATFTADDGTASTVSLPLTGINTQDALPRLGDATLDLDGDGTPETIRFDDACGRFEIFSGTSGELLWGTEIGASLNYTLVQLDDGSGGTVPTLAEFNDLPSARPVSSPSRRPEIPPFRRSARSSWPGSSIPRGFWPSAGICSSRRTRVEPRSPATRKKG